MKARIRQSSSVILRNGSGKIYLARRAPELRFFGGYWAFVGGVVGPEDFEGARAFGQTDDLDAYAYCAARELLEELGLDLTDRPLIGDELRVQRDRFGRKESDPKEYLELLQDRSLRPRLDKMQPVARLMTPPYSPLRYDTEFFLVNHSEFPGLPEPTVDSGELVDGAWEEADRWIERWHRGEILIAPPVLLILQVVRSRGWDAVCDGLANLSSTFGEKNIHTIFNNPATQVIPVKTPTVPPATHTNSLIVGRDPAYLVDPATPYPEDQALLAETVERTLAGGVVPERRLHAILLTHHHPDHVGAVEFARERWDLPVWAHETTRELLVERGIVVDRLLAEGDRLPLGPTPDGREGWELEVYHTPGHAAGHLCFLERIYGSFLVGDMASTISSILVRRSDGDMSQYMESLRRIASLPSDIVYPAHGPAGPGRLLQMQVAHREQRETSIYDAIRAGADDIVSVVEAVYSDVPREMHALAGQSVESVCDKLAKEGRILVEGDRLRLAP